MEEGKLLELCEGFYTTENLLSYLHKDPDRRIVLKFPGHTKTLGGLILYNPYKGITDIGKKVNLIKVNPRDYLIKKINNYFELIEEFSPLGKSKEQTSPKFTKKREYDPSKDPKYSYPKNWQGPGICG